MARVDLHLHTEYSRDSLSRLEHVAHRAAQAGLTHLAVTDHNTIRGALRMKELSDLPVIVGEEIMSAQGEIIGLFLSEPVPPGMSPQQTVDAIQQQGGLVYVPHPMDPFRRGLGTRGLQEIRAGVDIIEVFNSRCLLRSSNAEAAAQAGSLKAVAAAASDAHTLREIGRSYVEGPDFHDAPGLLRTLAAGTLTCRRSGAGVHLFSRVASLRHRIEQVLPS